MRDNRSRMSRPYGRSSGLRAFPQAGERGDACANYVHGGDKRCPAPSPQFVDFKNSPPPKTPQPPPPVTVRATIQWRTPCKSDLFVCCDSRAFRCPDKEPIGEMPVGCHSLCRAPPPTRKAVSPMEISVRYGAGFTLCLPTGLKTSVKARYASGCRGVSRVDCRYDDRSGGTEGWSVSKSTRNPA